MVSWRASYRSHVDSLQTALTRRLAGRPRQLVSLVCSLAIVLFVVGGWLASFSYDVTSDLPDKSELRGIGNMAQATTIYDAANEPVFTIYKEQRIEVPFDQISPHLIKAVLSVEDQRFYDHQGIDAFRIAAAFRHNMTEGRRAQGGSTITQQLARQTFLNRGKTYRRKAKEIILAGYLESYYSKDDILELYLNKVYFGEGFYGVEAASRGYFGKSASDLAIDEAALIAGLIQSPSSYAPREHLDKAISRRLVVLQSMVSAGAIDEATAARAARAPVRLLNGLDKRENFGLYFKEHVRRELVDRFGWERVSQGGLRVYTTMDSELQKAAETIVAQGLSDIERRPGFKHPRRGPGTVKNGQAPAYLQGALVSIDPATGYVRALVGGRSFADSPFNRAVQAKRQSGSAFKPFVFAAALESGFAPSSMITGLNTPIDTLQGDWVPEDEHSNASSMSLRAALKTSSNRAAVQLLNTIGIPTVVSFAEKLHVGTPPSVPSLALGSSDVTLLSLTSAYAAFAAEGIVREPVLIRRVDDSDGNVLFQDPQTSQRAVSHATAFLISSMLADVVNAGTAYRARQSGFLLPAAGKTGTTNEYVDAWFVGYTTQIVTGVWIGFDQPRTIIANGYGGELAVPIWSQFMKTATRDDKPEWFAPPADVTGANVCRASGKLANAACGSVMSIDNEGFLQSRSQVYTEYFANGTQPTSYCPIHTAESYIGTYGAAATTGTMPSPQPSGSTAPVPSLPPVAQPGTVPPLPGDPTATAPGPATPEQQRRGFWGRLFRGDKPAPPQKPPKKKPGGGGE
jgi:1A family penicillin-binding protein